MRTSKRNIFYKFIFLALLFWAAVATYSSVNNINVVTLVRSPFQEVPETFPLNLEEESQFLKFFLKEYYEISETTSKKGKMQSLMALFSNGSNGKEVLDEYANTLDYFKSKKGSQTFSLEKIFRDPSRHLYRGYLTVHQSFQEERSYLVRVELGISRRPHGYLVSTWREQMLKKQPQDLVEKVIRVGRDTVSHLRLPCETTSVSPVSGDTDIEMKLGPDSHDIRFYSDESFSGITGFKAKCGNRTFTMNLVYDPHLLTLYQAFVLSDGVQPRPLTPREKLEKVIETQLGIEIVN